MSEKKILMFVEEGVGNIVQAIPSCIAVSKLGYKVDIALRSNYPGMRRLLQIEEINNVFNIYIEKIPNPKSYEKVILTEFGHLNHYRDWKEDFEGIEIIQDSDLSHDLGKMNDVEINMRFARDLGYDGPTPEVKLNYPDNSTFQYFDNIICAGSGAYNKRWPYFSDLAKQLKGRVGIVGGPQEEKVAWPPNCVDMTGILELDEVASIVSKAGVYIGNDSGITHLANATGVPCVVVWGPTNLIKCKPWNNPVAIVSKNYPCQPCILIQSETRCEKQKKTRSCLIDVSVEEVLNATEQIRDCIDYRNEEDYTKYWASYYKINEENKSKEIIPYLDKVFKELELSGNRCVDFGCGNGAYIPFLNHFYKEINGVDIVDREIPKLNGVAFTNSEKEPLEPKEHDLLFICDTLSWLKPIYSTPVHMKGFKDLIIVDKISSSKNKKQKALNIEEIEINMGVKLKEVEKFKLTNGDEYAIWHGKSE